MIGIQIQTMPSCNGRCVFCPHSKSWLHNNHGMMENDIFDKILHEISALKVEKICPYLMNEPLIDPKIFERIEKIKNLNNFDFIELSTNASLLSSERADKLIYSFTSVNSVVWISFHGINKEQYELITGLDFDVVLNNVCDFLIKADGKVKVCINGSGGPFIKNEFSPQWFDKKEYNEFWSKRIKRLELKNKPKIIFFEYNDRAGNIEGSFNFRRDTLKDFRCERTEGWLHFLYTGELILCCNDYRKECIIGDIGKSSLAEILNSSQRKQIISKVTGREKSSISFLCKRCVKHWC